MHDMEYTFCAIQRTLLPWHAQQQGQQPMMAMFSTVAFLHKMYIDNSDAYLNYAVHLDSVSLTCAKLPYRQARRQSFNNACKDVASSTHG